MEVTLNANDKVLYQTQNRSRRANFGLSMSAGQYTFQRRCDREYAPAVREIVVTDEIVTALARKKLYVHSRSRRLRGCVLGDVVDEQIKGILDNAEITRIEQDRRLKSGNQKKMPRRNDIQKILVIGSGPIVIGQSAEFDYSGTQACKALKQEGYEVVLVNSNPATIMTDPELADRTYIEPLTREYVEEIIRIETAMLGRRFREIRAAAHGGRTDGVESCCRSGRCRHSR